MARVVRWEHATFVLDTVVPFRCERGGWKPGRRLRHATADAYSYGYDAEGRLLVSREGQFEYLHLHRPGAVERLQFDRHDIAWMREHGTAADQRKSERVRSRTILTFGGGRLVRLESTWPGRPKLVEAYEYEATGRLKKVHVSEPKHVDELEYDATGQLVRVVWRHPGGRASERFRRAPREDSLKLLLPELHAKLVEQIPLVLARARIRKPAYCLAISTCLEEAPHLLPPKLTVGLVADRDRRLVRGGEYALDEVWQPQSMPLHDHAKLALGDKALERLCARSRVARADDTPILKMLRRVAADLQRRGVDDVLACARDFIVFAVDVGGEDPRRAARRAAPVVAKRLARAALL
jgi:hypothetical protein